MIDFLKSLWNKLPGGGSVVVPNVKDSDATAAVKHFIAIKEFCKDKPGAKEHLAALWKELEPNM